MQQLTPEKKLDIALEFLSTHGAKGGSYDWYDDRAKERGYDEWLFKYLLTQNISENEHLPIIYKLHRDKFLDTFYDKTNGEQLGERPTQIRISFEGIMLISNGGYEQTKKANETNQARIKRNELIIMIGTGFAGLYALVQFFQ
ncbi:MAG: hypothetical protein HUU48_09650 [Flavobacteriales bacterium]|nr:hypothetical protein [Flavobacteriales bacterium]